jgi:hypothetical protein
MADDVTPECNVSPPNGERITQATLYKALYDLDQGLSSRLTTILDVVVCAQDAALQLREDFEAHREDGHPQNRQAETVREEIKLDTKKAAIVASVLTLLTVVTTLLLAAISGGI